MIEATLLSQVKTLSAVDRIELLGVVWETLTPEDAPVTAEEKQLLDARLADVQQNPVDQSPWREVQARMRLSLP
ncbi:MAG: addiction module protein [Burkholderiales bacterium]